LRDVQARSEPILGIDIGTTFSTAALVVGGRFHYATDERGEACVPSVVHFPRSGLPVVGFEADRLRQAEPEHTISGVKRLIGRSLDSPQARLVGAGTAFRMVGTGQDEVKIRVRTAEYTASEVAAVLMKHLRDLAQQRFQRQLTRAVVTVPVLAPPQVREAMVRIGKMAGLEVVRVVSESVAGALARGIAGAGDEGAPRLVFDFGGGTLDLAVVQRQGRQVKVLSAGGDDLLGGDDFDTELARWAASQIWGTFQVDVTRDAILAAAIQRQCERVKRALSSGPSARCFLPDALGAGGRRWDVDLLMTRDNVRPVWAELVERAMDVTRSVIAAAGCPTEALSMISLIGGTTFMPQVREAVAQTFGRPLDIESDPQTAVARGAALLGALPDLID
jgi:molecular chaperone DnaK (HSP70)